MRAQSHRASPGLAAAAKAGRGAGLGSRTVQTQAAAPPVSRPQRVARAREAAGRAGLSPSGPPAHSPALRGSPSAQAADTRLGLPAHRPHRGARFAPRTPTLHPRPPARTCWESGMSGAAIFPRTRAPSARETGAGPRVRTGVRGGARAAESARGRDRNRAAHARPNPKGRGRGRVRAH